MSTITTDYKRMIDKWGETFHKIDIFLNGNPNLDKSILIPFSCNYETWIFRNAFNKICVQTCNNCDWILPWSDIQWLGDGGHYDLESDNPGSWIPQDRLFIDIGNDFVKTRASDYFNIKYNSSPISRYKLGDYWENK